MTLDAQALLNAHPMIARFANQPALLLPGSESRLAACLRGNAEYDETDAYAGPAGLPPTYGAATPELRYARQGSLAIIPIRGSLLHGSRARNPYATGYTYIREAAFAAEQDPEIAGIVYVHDSPGGEVAGNFDLAEDLAALSKPSIAIVDEDAYSASYSLASAADRIVVSRTGGVGSIGVFTAHVDLSKFLEEVGVAVTFIHAGEHKVDGNPFEPLGDGTRQRMQSRIDGLYEMFVGIVARHRGLDAQSVRDTKALTFSGEEAVAAGLADAVMSPEQALAEFMQQILGTTSGGVIQMTQAQQPKPAQPGTQQTTQPPAQPGTQQTAQPPDTDGSSGTASVGTGLGPAAQDVEQARAEGAAAERERIRSIVQSEEAATRPAVAQQLAYQTSMSAEEARQFLASVPAEQGAASPGADAFSQAMEQTGNPNVPAEAEAGSADEATAADRILGNYQRVTGRGRS